MDSHKICWVVHFKAWLLFEGMKSRVALADHLLMINPLPISFVVYNYGFEFFIFQ